MMTVGNDSDDNYDDVDNDADHKDVDDDNIDCDNIYVVYDDDDNAQNVWPRTGKYVIFCFKELSYE